MSAISVCLLVFSSLLDSVPLSVVCGVCLDSPLKLTHDLFTSNFDQFWTVNVKRCLEQYWPIRQQRDIPCGMLLLHVFHCNHGKIPKFTHIYRRVHARTCTHTNTLTNINEHFCM